jgi:hypothetical protein
MTTNTVLKANTGQPPLAMIAKTSGELIQLMNAEP